MFCLLKLTNSVNLKQVNCKRNFWQWLNIVFNNVDEDRRKAFGPNRTCAEWLLRNGGAVKWTTASEFLADYNQLPAEDLKLKLYIKEVDATDSSISHYGFPHFIGCKDIEKIILHRCIYLEDEALPLLEPLKDTLKFLQVSGCGNISEVGINSLTVLSNLQTLIMFDLPSVKNKAGVLVNLTSHLPQCSISLK